MGTKLLQPAAPEPARPSVRDLDNARAVIAQSPVTYAHLALLGDKALLFNEDKSAFLMYGVQGRSWVSIGDPIGPEKEQIELLWRFREMADAHDGWTVFYEVGRTNLSMYVDLGLALLKLGEEARVPLDHFALEGQSWKNHRHIINQLEKKGVPSRLSVRLMFPNSYPTQRHLRVAGGEENQGKRVLAGFFQRRLPEKFSRGNYSGIRPDSRIRQHLVGGGKMELSVDLMRYLPAAPDGVMEYLFLKLMIWGAERGFKWFNLGMAPLSGLENRSLAPVWNKVGNFIFQYGENFYNFEGLRQYKEKFHPVWEPKYLAAPSGFRLPTIFANISSLIAGGFKGIISK